MRHRFFLSTCFLFFAWVPFVASGGPRGPAPDEELGLLANTDLAAVQKPLFSMRRKLEVSGHTALLPGDPYVVGVLGGVGAAYYFSERLAADVLLSYGNGFETFESTRLQELGVRVDSYTPRFVCSFNAQWTPIYAKLNLLGYRVVHFDTSLTGGVGAFVARRTIYNDVEASPEAARFNLPASINVGINQRYFARIANHTAALKLELRDYLYVLRTVTDTSGIKHNWFLSLGITWYFDLFEGGGPRE